MIQLLVTQAGGRRTSPRHLILEKTAVALPVAVVVLSQLIHAPEIRGESTERPNIILIMADDLGYGDVGCFGSERFETPNIDSIAEDGIRLTDFHSNGAVCSPTRAALLTGRYQQRTGITGVVTAAGHRHTGLDLTETTFAEVLKSAGYKTGMFGKWHVGYQPEFNPVHQGFDEFVGYVSGNVDYHLHIDQTGREDWWKQDQLTPEEGYSTDLITEHGVRFIERNKDRPFLLYLAHEAPHYPFQGRQSPPRYVKGKGRNKDPVTPEVYKEMIEVMDEGIGRIRDTVNKAGIREKTLIIFFSDNGPAAIGSAGPLRGKKGQIWEGGHRVPAAICWPGQINAGRVSDVTAMGADLLPTMVEAAGAELPQHVTIDGVSLLSHLLDTEPVEERALFWGTKRGLAIRQGDYKLITDSSFTKPTLYNLKNDLGEKKDISAKEPEVVRDLLNALKKWHTEVNAGVKRRT